MNDNLKRFMIKLAAAIVVMIVMVFLVLGFMKSKPKVKRKKPVSITPVVTVAPLKVTDHQTVIEVMGTVIPAKEVTIRSRVTGEVVQLHPDFLEGGFVQKGEVLVQLDDIDYKIVQKQMQASLVKYESELDIEKGQQDIAKREWELIGPDENSTDSDRELALRVPQLKSKQATFDAAKVALEKATIDVERTKVKAPFNSLILSADIQVGDQANSQTQMARLVGTDSFHVQTSIPVSKLGSIDIPQNYGEKGAVATIIAKGNRRYKGRVIKLLGDIEPNGKMARVLVKIDDPMNLKGDGTNRLLLGEYVTVLINGEVLDDAIAVPRTAYHNNAEVWVLNADDRLRTVKTSPIWEERKTVYIQNGFKPGEKLITSDLTFPVEGMVLNIFADQGVEK